MEDFEVNSASAFIILWIWNDRFSLNYHKSRFHHFPGIFYVTYNQYTGWHHLYTLPLYMVQFKHSSSKVIFMQVCKKRNDKKSCSFIWRCCGRTCCHDQNTWGTDPLVGNMRKCFLWSMHIPKEKEYFYEKRVRGNPRDWWHNMMNAVTSPQKLSPDCNQSQVTE